MRPTAFSTADTMARRVPYAHGDVRLAEVLSALTYALDLTGGQRPGHTLRTVLIAMRLGDAVGIDASSRAALYYATLLKDSGCSSNAARMSAMFGADDQFVKHDMRLVDWHDLWGVAKRTAQNCGIGRNPIARVAHFLRVVTKPSFTREILQLRCERGAQISLALGFPRATAEAINFVDEHWCGRGHPIGLSGVEIPLFSRIVLLAQTFEAIWTEHGLRTALEMVRKRRAVWFDPTLVDHLVSWRHDAAFWAQLTHRQQLEAAVVAREPGDVPMAATDDRLDKIAYAFAAVIDAKTPFTYKHSSNVAKYAVGIATAVGADDAMLRHVLRAGLLHDVGKLGISNRILDKPAPLTEAERIEIMKHPEYTWQILERVSAFRPFARSASLHHERLDGSGYPWKLSGEALDFTARTIAIADVYEALTAERPYRSAMPVHDVLLIMRRDGDRAFDGTLLDAAAALAEGGVFAQLAADGDDAITQLRAHALTPLIPRAAIAA